MAWRKTAKESARTDRLRQRSRPPPQGRGGRGARVHPGFGVVGLVLAPLFALGSLEFVGPLEPHGWKLAGALVPLAYLGWSVWLLALGVDLLVTA
jgi:hypothetical protein